MARSGRIGHSDGMNRGMGHVDNRVEVRAPLGTPRKPCRLRTTVGISCGAPRREGARFASCERRLATGALRREERRGKQQRAGSAASRRGDCSDSSKAGVSARAPRATKKGRAVPGRVRTCGGGGKTHGDRVDRPKLTREAARHQRQQASSARRPRAFVAVIGPHAEGQRSLRRACSRPVPPRRRLRPRGRRGARRWRRGRVP